MQDGDNDIVFGRTLGGEPGGQRIIMPKCARDDGWPGLQSDADKLRDADAAARFQFVQDGLQFRTDYPRDISGSALSHHQASFDFGMPRMSAMRPVRASS